MRLRSKPLNRRGGSLVEGVITSSVLVTLALGMVDVGFAVFQNHLVSDASRQGARIASLHGSLAPVDGSGSSWGPASYSGDGNAADAIPTALRNAGSLAGLDTSNVTISVLWPTGGNSVQNGDTVQFTVSTTWTPVFFYIFGTTPYKLSATSIMPVAH
jgi:Flp pilus assembly protein TadG